MSTVTDMERTSPFGSAVAAAVRAEVARAGLRVADVIGVLELSRNTAYSRFRGDTAFTADELGRVAARLGIDPGVFFMPVKESA